MDKNNSVAIGAVTQAIARKIQSLRPEQRPPTVDYLWWIVHAGRGFGKLLELSTPIPTPKGFVKIGDINVGDTVFDEKGVPCKVTNVFDDLPEKSFRITFRDGTVLYAGGEHQWVTWTHLERKCFLRHNCKETMPEDWVNWRSVNKNAFGEYTGPRIRTTEQIFDTMTQGIRGDLNHCIPTCFPVEMEEQVLPLPPYVFGYWLGNGDRKQPVVTCHGDDTDFVAKKFAEKGYNAVSVIKDKRSNCHRFRFANKASLDFCVDKSIPEKYLWASIRQRTDLLHGLMDSDGYNAGKYVEFCSKDKHISEAVFHLAASLGQKPVIKESDATLYGKLCGKRYRVTWVPTIQVFSSPRKVAKTLYGQNQQFKHQHRMITSIEPAPIVPMRCLTVDSPNHMYLVGETFIPTHNTHTGSTWTLSNAIRYPGTLWLVGAPTYNDVKNICVEGESGLLGVLGDSIDYCDYKPSQNQLLLPNKSMIRWSGAEKPDRFRGSNLAGAWLDEAATMYKFHELEATLIPSIRKKPGRILVTTTPQPNPWIIEMMTTTDPLYVRTSGSILDNRANLDEFMVKHLIEKYEGTSLGRQELYGELVFSAEGALWSHEDFVYQPLPNSWSGAVVAVDPAMSSHQNSDETGIVVAVCDGKNIFIVEDLSGRHHSTEYPKIVARAAERYGAYVFVEDNQGGDFVLNPIRQENPNLIVKGGKARFDKGARAAEPRRLYELGKVKHCSKFTVLEQQMCSWVPKQKKSFSPDRVDALVWAVSELQWMVEGSTQMVFSSPASVEGRRRLFDRFR